MQPDLETETEHSSIQSIPKSQSLAPSEGSLGADLPLQLERRLDGKLWLSRDGYTLAVEIVRCFPWSGPDRLLSLRDETGVERAFIPDMAALDPRSRATLKAGLERSGFVLDVVRVLAVEEDFELRSFTVETAQGRRRFQTALDAWPRELDSGALVLEDVYGDLYRVRNPKQLDALSRKQLSAFLD